MIAIGIDDTDTKDTRGTNAVARALLAKLGYDAGGRRARVLRHQLLDDPRVPYTSKNGSASIVLEDAPPSDAAEIAAELRAWMRAWFIEGSDPGLCVVSSVPGEVVSFALRCKRELVEQGEARAIAAAQGVLLEGLGGTEGGVIGALAAVRLAATGDDRR
ncbi:MAG TPA: hypothetical protein VHB21_08550, partial [Minicystis sp.]|nr:hypothetical protein [Minicystis sp.]